MNWSKEMKIAAPIGLIIMLIIFSLLIVYWVWANRKSKKNNTIGFRFENKIKNIMSLYAKDKGFKFIEGGLFSYGANQFFEVDGILITNKSIFIIETKAYEGHINGNAVGEQVTITNNNKVKKLKNPLLQNFKHIKHFYKMCGIAVPIFSLIIFPENTTYDFEQLDSWAIIANENNINQTMQDVFDDLEEDADISNEEIMHIVQVLQDGRKASIRDLKVFGKIGARNGRR
ncbi:nuclease-related domain-containing protein [Mycoplasma sp. Mirounga ES2805-ORL]|uniref:nuclease-related domain-containing protein n=1 Tax=Mycoplasma sp. Mirounga ES2805-ORL TaxID=754514 RepID=UPI00197CA981|nr:nuclease-related domain-containing protein [Mycoplasma sp. Mirounga ES2805-ORL]QSF13592.1 NERD domain-containing protein [Mycoplasma sp. Mirounga ES2805-ORL]